jgi:hypothetical protein
MEPAIIGLVGVLIGAAISTGATFWLAVRKKATETRNWRRDRCLEAYSEYVRQVDAITVEAGNRYRSPCGSEEYAKHGVMLLEKLSELYRTNHRVILLASDELQAPISALTRHVTGDFVTKSNLCPKAPDAEVKAAGVKLAELNADFMLKARNDLGVHAKQPWWRFGR